MQAFLQISSNIQAATCIPAEHAAVEAVGPADCTPSASEVFQTMTGEVAGVPAGAASGMPAGQPAA